MNNLICIVLLFVAFQYACAEQDTEGGQELGYNTCTASLKLCVKRWYCKQWPVKSMWCKCGKELVECCDAHFNTCLQEDLNSMLVYTSCRGRYSMCQALAYKRFDD